MLKKYQKLKEHYSALKDHYNANKLYNIYHNPHLLILLSTIQTLHNGTMNNQEQIEELEKQLSKCLHEQKLVEQENNELKGKLNEEVTHRDYLKQHELSLENRHKSQIEDLKRELREKGQQINEYREMFHKKLESHAREIEEIIKDKAVYMEQFGKAQDKLARIYLDQYIYLNTCDRID